MGEAPTGNPLPAEYPERGLLLRKIYRQLNDYFGDLHWWPGETAFEVIVGAILTQNTAWTNVEKSIRGMKGAGMLTPGGLHGVPHDTLQSLIRSSGYFRIKADRLKAFARFLFDRFDGDLDRMFATNAETLRRQLLSVHGIGEETADSILLYAGGLPVFVVDAYTRRILSRHGIASETAPYGKIQRIFMDALAPDTRVFNQYHALLVNAGKHFCRKRPRCAECPLSGVEGREPGFRGAGMEGGNASHGKE